MKFMAAAPRGRRREIRVEETEWPRTHQSAAKVPGD
jgi:hypothetical protein